MNDEIAELFKKWKQHKAENILTYRDKNFRSVVTGTMANPLAKRWSECMDDSLQAFLDGCKD